MTSDFKILSLKFVFYTGILSGVPGIITGTFKYRRDDNDRGPGDFGIKSGLAYEAASTV